VKHLFEAAEHALNTLGKNSFFKCMREKFQVTKPDDADLSVVDAIWSLRPPLVVTTNYENVLSWSKPESVRVLNHQRAEFAELLWRNDVDQPTVWHLHGHVDDADSLILATVQYEEFYSEKARQDYQAAMKQLENLMTSYTFLFIGFGLEDQYVMEQFENVLKTFNRATRPHFALMTQAEADQKAEHLWDQYNIQVLPYEDHGPPLVEKLNELAKARQDQEASADPGERTQPQTPLPPVPTSYREWLTGQCADITPRGMEVASAQSVQLNQVYVPLRTSSRLEEFDEASAGFEMRSQERAEDQAPKLVLNALNERSLYVSGGPGSGKSTFCRWCAWLAIHASMPEFAVRADDEYREAFPDSFHDRLPLLIRLSELAAHLPATATNTLTVDQLEQTLQQWLETTYGSGLTWNVVKPRLDGGKLLLLLDGVDEVPLGDAHDGQGSPDRQSPRETLLTAITPAAATWIESGSRLLLTSRPYGLATEQVRELARVGLVEAQLDPLPESLQDLLAKRWFTALPKFRAQANQMAKDMLGTVRALSEDVSALSANPLLLTAVCIIYGEGKELPRRLWPRTLSWPAERRLLPESGPATSPTEFLEI
jgi:hypothetical protein